MKTPYLIQRMEFKKYKDDSNCFNGLLTFDGLLSMDYMGSSEFEFGTLPTSLKKLCKNIHDLTISQLNIKNIAGQSLFLICKPEVEGKPDYDTTNTQKYEDYITQMVENKLRTKESVNISAHVTGKNWSGEDVMRPKNPRQKKEFQHGIKPYELKTDAWWDVENNVIFVFGKENAKKILAAINTTMEKKKSQGQHEWYTEEKPGNIIAKASKMKM